MKKLVIVVMAMAMVAGYYGYSYSNGFGTGISTVGSPHNFSAETWNTREEICRVCHVPHDHNKPGQNYLNGLLWNHDVSTATYTMYGSAWSSSITGVQSAQPDGTSKLCLGCHDGTVGIDAFDGHTTPATEFIGASSERVPNFVDGAHKDLRGTHPLSIAFPAGEIGTKFNDPATTNWQAGGTVASTLQDGKVQCSTCHDVHDKDAVPATHLLKPAAKASQGTASGLCLACHIK